MSRSKDQLVYDILRDLTQSVRAVVSMAQGGEYEETRLWSVEYDLGLLLDRLYSDE